MMRNWEQIFWQRITFGGCPFHVTGQLGQGTGSLVTSTIVSHTQHMTKEAEICSIDVVFIHAIDNVYEALTANLK